MDYKKTNAPTNTITRNMMELCEDTGNVYETVAIIGKRSNQIATEMKSDLSKKLQEFASYAVFCRNNTEIRRESCKVIIGDFRLRCGNSRKN